jgi:hypothetical protein
MVCTLLAGGSGVGCGHPDSQATTTATLTAQDLTAVSVIEGSCQRNNYVAQHSLPQLDAGLAVCLEFNAIEVA